MRADEAGNFGTTHVPNQVQVVVRLQVWSDAT